MMTSKRERRVQRLIQYMKTYCSTCPKKNYSECLECKHYKDSQELLYEIENDGGDKYE